MMRASEFIQEYAKKGHTAWEAAAISLARQGELNLWPWVDLPLTDGKGNTAIVRVQSDVLSIGTPEDFIRLPMTPNTAQAIANLIPGGALLTTPWLEYQIWRAAQHKLQPTDMAPNKGINLDQFREHSALIDNQLAARGAKSGELVAGHKKGVVIANFYKPGKVLICCWFRPPPAEDTFDDRKQIGTPGRQPVQPKSNIHGDFYFDYSHGIRLVYPMAYVNGEEVPTATLYQSPTLWRLVSDPSDGPLKVLRYPTNVPVTPSAAPAFASLASGPEPEPSRADFSEVPIMPSISDYAIDRLMRQRHARMLAMRAPVAAGSPTRPNTGRLRQVSTGAIDRLGRVRIQSTPGRDSAVRCTWDSGCAIYPLFTMNRGVAQGVVRRASFVLPANAQITIAGNAIRVPDDRQSPIRTVSVKAGIPRVEPDGAVYPVRYSGTMINPRTGVQFQVTNFEGYVNAAHIR